jgi:hypothetical protein
MATLEPKRVVAPEPPVRLAEIDLPLTEVSATWFRFSAQRYHSPIFWSRQGRYRFHQFTGTLKIFEPNGEIRIGLLTENANVTLDTPSGATIKIFACQNPGRFAQNKNVEIVHPDLRGTEVSEQAIRDFFGESPAFRALLDAKDRIRTTVNQADRRSSRRLFWRR